jgi:hypothetical protein
MVERELKDSLKLGRGHDPPNLGGRDPVTARQQIDRLATTESPPDLLFGLLGSLRDVVRPRRRQFRRLGHHYPELSGKFPPTHVLIGYATHRTPPHEDAPHKRVQARIVYTGRLGAARQSVAGLRGIGFQPVAGKDRLEAYPTPAPLEEYATRAPDSRNVVAALT